MLIALIGATAIAFGLVSLFQIVMEGQSEENAQVECSLTAPRHTEVMTRKEQGQTICVYVGRDGRVVKERLLNTP